MKPIEIENLLIENKICSLGSILHCSQEEVDSLEKSVGVKFSISYRNFLLVMGKGAGELFQGTDIFFPAIIGIKQDAQELLNDNGIEFTLSNTDVVFMMHQGYEFCFFDCVEGESAPVFQYVEGQGIPVITWNSFDHFLISEIKALRTLQGKNTNAIDSI